MKISRIDNEVVLDGEGKSVYAFSTNPIFTIETNGICLKNWKLISGCFIPKRLVKLLFINRVLVRG